MYSRASDILYLQFHFLVEIILQEQVLQESYKKMHLHFQTSRDKKSRQYL